MRSDLGDDHGGPGYQCACECFDCQVGKPAQILARVDEFELLLSEAILSETNEVLHRKHILKRYPLSEADIVAYLDLLREMSRLIFPQTIENVIKNDPPDNLVLACAVEGKADYLVSGNQHFLQLQEYRQIKMVKPAEFLRILDIS